MSDRYVEYEFADGATYTVPLDLDGYDDQEQMEHYNPLGVFSAPFNSASPAHGMVESFAQASDGIGMALYDRHGDLVRVHVYEMDGIDCRSWSEAFRIFSRYPVEDIASEHDEVYAGPQPESMSPADRQRLEELRWHIHEAYDCFVHFT